MNEKSDDRRAIRSFADVGDLLRARGAGHSILLDENDFAPEFFDLRSGLAGELFQKFANYRLRVAIVVADPSVYGERFKELAYEHRSHSIVRIVGLAAQGRAWLETVATPPQQRL